MSLKSLADIQRITKEKNKNGRKCQRLFIKAFTFYKTVNNYIRELYVQVTNTLENCKPCHQNVFLLGWEARGKIKMY